MICVDCRRGADAVSLFLEINADPAWETQDTWMVTVGEDHHEKCKGCDCQHDVDGQLSGKVIQR